MAIRAPDGANKAVGTSNKDPRRITITKKRIPISLGSDTWRRHQGSVQGGRWRRARSLAQPLIMFDHRNLAQPFFELLVLHNLWSCYIWSFRLKPLVMLYLMFYARSKLLLEIFIQDCSPWWWDRGRGEGWRWPGILRRRSGGRCTPWFCRWWWVHNRVEWKTQKLEK